MSSRKLSVFFLTIAVVMIGIGIWRDEAATVLSKGINICLECVGIG